MCYHDFFLAILGSDHCFFRYKQFVVTLWNLDPDWKPESIIGNINPKCTFTFDNICFLINPRTDFAAGRFLTWEIEVFMLFTKWPEFNLVHPIGEIAKYHEKRDKKRSNNSKNNQHYYTTSFQFRENVSGRGDDRNQYYYTTFSKKSQNFWLNPLQMTNICDKISSFKNTLLVIGGYGLYPKGGENNE